MEMNRMIAMFMEYCKSKQLRERTMLSYEQSLKLFAVWLEDVEEITHVEKIKEMNIRRYIIELQSRGKYTFYSRKGTPSSDSAVRRRDYNDMTSIQFRMERIILRYQFRLLSASNSMLGCLDWGRMQRS